MKNKLSLILVLLMLVMAVLPLSVALATPSTAGILRGLTSTEGYTKMTDGSDSTYQQLNDGNKATFVLSGSYNISAYYFHTNGAKVDFYNQADVKIGSTLTVGDTHNTGGFDFNAYVPIVYSGVKKVVVTTSGLMNHYEFDLQGTKVPDSNKLTVFSNSSSWHAYGAASRVPANLFDGLSPSDWDMNTDSQTSGDYVTVDLGSKKHIGDMSFILYSNYSNTAKHDFLVSDNGTDFTSVLTDVVFGSVGSVYTPKAITLNADGRYVKMLKKDTARTFLGEWELYGYGLSATTNLIDSSTKWSYSSDLSSGVVGLSYASSYPEFIDGNNSTGQGSGSGGSFIAKLASPVIVDSFMSYATSPITIKMYDLQGNLLGTSSLTTASNSSSIVSLSSPIPNVSYVRYYHPTLGVTFREMGLYGSVGGSPRGLLYGKNMFSSDTPLGSASGAGYTSVTDDNDSTTKDLEIFCAGCNENIAYVFTPFVKIESYRMKMKAGTSATELAVLFYDGSGVELKRVTNPVINGDVTLLSSPVSNVKRVVFASLSGNAKTVLDVDVFAAAPDTTAPPVPTNLKASNIVSGSVKLDWDMNSSSASDFAGWNVYKNGVKENSSLLVTNTYTASGLQDNVSYSFVVKAVDSSNNESAASNAVSTLSDTVSPLAPIGLMVNGKTAAAGSVSSAELTWSASTEPDLAGYNVFANSTKRNPSLVLETRYVVDSLSANVSYSFQVTAVDTSTNESQKSSAVTYVFDTMPPSIPVGLSGVSGDTTSILSWSAEGSPDLDGYNVYRDAVKVNSSLVKTNSFTDSALINGNAYSYKVSAVDKLGNESPRSSSVTVVPTAPAAPPSAPITVNVSNRDSALIVNWSAVAGSSGYNVYLDGAKVNSSVVTATNYTLAGLVNDQSYSIQVSAVNSVGEGTKSVSVSGKPSGKALPVIEYNYSLKDITNSVGNWFSSIWLVLAFSIAVPLSFLIGRRVKGLFD